MQKQVTRPATSNSSSSGSGSNSSNQLTAQAQQGILHISHAPDDMSAPWSLAACTAQSSKDIQKMMVSSSISAVHFGVCPSGISPLKPGLHQQHQAGRRKQTSKEAGRQTGKLLSLDQRICEEHCQHRGTQSQEPYSTLSYLCQKT